MNLILFEPDEIGQPLARADRRSAHIVEVLRRTAGEAFDAGVVNGPRGKGIVREIRADTLLLDFAWSAPAGPIAPISLIIGLPRPQTARDILRDLTTLGVAALDFVRTEKGEPNYAQSALWRDGEWKRHLRLGAEQAFDTHVPAVAHGLPLAGALDRVSKTSTRFALDNYEASVPLSEAACPADRPVVLAIGSERGWSAAERDLLRESGFLFVHLGSRVLRTETACIAAATLLHARLGWFQAGR